MQPDAKRGEHGKDDMGKQVFARASVDVGAGDRVVMGKKKGYIVDIDIKKERRKRKRKETVETLKERFKRKRKMRRKKSGFDSYLW